MTPETMLFRQIHSSFIQAGVATSQAFRPTPKDDNKLSTYDGDLISPEDSHSHYTRELKLESAGVLGLKSQDFSNNDLVVIEDREPFEEHISIDFSQHGSGKQKSISKLLASIANGNGWLFLAE